MHTITNASLYDYPKYYDLVFGADWKAEFEFLTAIFDKHATGNVRRVFEPACGTGRLLFRLAKAGYDVGGLDINAKAIAYCNRRFGRHGFPESAIVGDMRHFRLLRKVDASFNMINSFRHLNHHEDAVAHLQCVARSLRKGGIYALGLHLTPTDGEPMEEEQWSGRRGNLTVLSHLKTLNRELRTRQETFRLTFDVYTPSKIFRLTNKITFRTYTARQMKSLLQAIPSLELLATYDFAYNAQKPIRVRADTEDVVYVLGKR